MPTGNADRKRRQQNADRTILLMNVKDSLLEVSHYINQSFLKFLVLA